jgi:hypothetical protein
VREEVDGLFKIVLLFMRPGMLSVPLDFFVNGCFATFAFEAGRFETCEES